MSNELGTALITGASTGIGAIYADRLVRRGYDLILVARQKDKLDALAERLVRETGRTVKVLPADLSKATELAKVETLLKEDAAITLLVNNAGIASTAKLVDADVDRMSDIISLNTNALTRLTYAAVPGFVLRDRGTVINIASIVAVYPEILNGVYAASKAFVLAFTQSLQNELKDTAVKAQAVLPGATSTDMWELAGTPLANLPVEIVMTADAMVDAALIGFDLGEAVTIPALPDPKDWQAFENTRLALHPNLSKSEPAARYLPDVAA
ncbi:SDR family NAD(P)-dependent oxidoreductase [Agrobacterium tumefaciens]|uniref:SDR family NAD(P)-dependent oxidoreductase n=1 Tax=Agrobacterium tumefaciens TaxID=358 RepID=UPI000B0D1B38